MDEKKVREAIELMNKLKKHTDIWFGVSPVLEGKDKMAKECFDIAIEALEKQLPKKSDKAFVKFVHGTFEEKFCPKCKELLDFGKYCSNCGQKLAQSE